jgi:hypothetical protein
MHFSNDIESEGTWLFTDCADCLTLAHTWHGKGLIVNAMIIGFAAISSAVMACFHTLTRSAKF